MDPKASYAGFPVAPVIATAAPATTHPATAAASSATIATEVGSRPDRTNSGERHLRRLGVFTERVVRDEERVRVDDRGRAEDAHADPDVLEVRGGDEGVRAVHDGDAGAGEEDADRADETPNEALAAVAVIVRRVGALRELSMPVRRRLWFAMSATLCTASASIAEEPVTPYAASLHAKMAELARTATPTACNARSSDSASRRRRRGDARGAPPEAEAPEGDSEEESEEEPRDASESSSLVRSERGASPPRARIATRRGIRAGSRSRKKARPTPNVERPATNRGGAAGAWRARQGVHAEARAGGTAAAGRDGEARGSGIGRAGGVPTRKTREAARGGAGPRGRARRASPTRPRRKGRRAARKTPRARAPARRARTARRDIAAWSAEGGGGGGRSRRANQQRASRP